MRSNLDEFNVYLQIINDKISLFVDDVLKRNNLPDKIYYVYDNGDISDRRLVGNWYDISKHGVYLDLIKAKPSKRDITNVEKISKSDLIFSKRNLYFIYLDYENNTEHSISFNYLVNKINIFTDMEDALLSSTKIKNSKAAS